MTSRMKSKPRLQHSRSTVTNFSIADCCTCETLRACVSAGEQASNVCCSGAPFRVPADVLCVAFNAANGGRVPRGHASGFNLPSELRDTSLAQPRVNVPAFALLAAGARRSSPTSLPLTWFLIVGCPRRPTRWSQSAAARQARRRARPRMRAGSPCASSRAPPTGRTVQSLLRNSAIACARALPLRAAAARRFAANVDAVWGTSTELGFAS